MDLSFLPKNYLDALSFVDLSKLTEIRMREGFPVTVIYSFKRAYLYEKGVSILSNSSILCKKEDINAVINTVTEYSVYAFNDMIKNGFLISKGGIRIGLGGECVTENGQVQTIKNISSLNIRIPHLIDGCAKDIYGFIYESGKINSSLIISPPFYGKTTMLKDTIKKLNELNKYSILILDERGEFELIKGENIDKITYSDKLYGLKYGLRTLTPNVVITDELSNENDWDCALSAVTSGVSIIASCHGKSVFDLTKKTCFRKGVFDRYFILGDVGILSEIYDGEFNRL